MMAEMMMMMMMIYFGNMINQQRCFQLYAMSEPLLEIFTTEDF